MDETIRIRPIDPKDWSVRIPSFELNKIEQILEVFGSDGSVIGTICESVEGKYYINGQTDFNYASLQAATAALLNNKN